MSYARRDGRGMVVFRDQIGTIAEAPILIPQLPLPPPIRTVDPDQAWANIYQAIGALTAHFIAVAHNTKHSVGNGRVMDQFLAEWSPLLAERNRLGTQLRGTIAQKGAVVISVGLALQQLVLRAHQSGIPDPPLELGRDWSWLYLTPDTSFAKAG